jgi:hypothetical protein
VRASQFPNRLEQPFEGRKYIGIRFSFGQCSGNQGSSRCQTGQPVGIVEQPRSMRPHQLAGDSAKVLTEASAPHRRNLIAGLQHPPQLWRLPAANKAGMPAVLCGQKLDDRCVFAMAAGRKDERSVMPFHQVS